MNPTPPESPDRRRGPGAHPYGQRTQQYRFPQNTTPQQFSPARVPVRSRTVPSPQSTAAFTARRSAKTFVSGSVGLNPRSAAWSAGRAAEPAAKTNPTRSAAQPRTITMGRGVGRLPLLDPEGNPVGDVPEFEDGEGAEPQENWENYAPDDAEAELVEGDEAAIGDEQPVDNVDAEDDANAVGTGSPPDSETGFARESRSSLLNMNLDGEPFSMTPNNAATSSPTEREREAKAIFESNGVSLTKFLREGSAGVINDGDLLSPGGDSTASPGGGVSEKGGARGGRSGGGGARRSSEDDSTSGGGSGSGSGSVVDGVVDEDDGEEMGREAVAVLSGEQLPGALISSEPASSPGGAVTLPAGSRDSELRRTNIDTVGSAVSLASHNHIMQATKAQRKEKEREAKQREKDALVTREWRGLEIENLDLSGLTPPGSKLTSSSSSSSSANSHVHPPKEKVTEAVAAPSKGNPIVEIQRVSLLYDPPVELCQLKPYVSLRTADGQTMALRNDKESMRWVEFRWSRGQRRICNKLNCGQGATLQCLDCVKRNVPIHLSFFCSDECLREIWASHLLVHKQYAASAKQAKIDQNEGKFVWNEDDGEDFKGKKASEVEQSIHAKYPPPIPNVWTEVSRSRSYTPQNDDVGRALRLEVAPVLYPSPSTPTSSTSSSTTSSSASSSSSSSSPSTFFSSSPTLHSSTSPINANNYHESLSSASATASSSAPFSSEAGGGGGGGGGGGATSSSDDPFSDVISASASFSASSVGNAHHHGGHSHGGGDEEEEDEDDDTSNTYIDYSTLTAMAAAQQQQSSSSSSQTQSSGNGNGNGGSSSSTPGVSTNTTPKQSPLKYVKKKTDAASKKDDNVKKVFGKWHRLETSPIIPAPTPPPPRRMRYNNPTNASGHSFKTVCYNVLADIYATKHFFPYCKVWALSWAFRKAQLMRDILSHQADVICLQEVQANHFEKWFQPNLHKAGYDGIFKKKTRESVTDNPNTIDGCAIFYKRDRFALMEQYGIEFNEAARQQTSDRRALKRLLKGNIALVVVLEDIGGDNKAGSGSSGGANANVNASSARRRRKRRVCIANTHIHWDPECADVKLWQTFILLQELEKLVMHRNLPLVLCGDFNSMTDSSVYELLTTERVDPKHRIFREDPYQILPDPSVMTHRLPLVSAYFSIGELKYTNYTGHFVGTLDYIFYSKNHMVHAAVLDSDKEEHLKRHTALPSPQFSSDHISLLTELDWVADPS